MAEGSTKRGWTIALESAGPYGVRGGDLARVNLRHNGRLIVSQDIPGGPAYILAAIAVLKRDFGATVADYGPYCPNCLALNTAADTARAGLNCGQCGLRLRPEPLDKS